MRQRIVRGKVSASTRKTFQLKFTGFTSSHHITMFSHELPSLPKTNIKSEGSGNVNGLNIKNRTHTQSRSSSVI